MSCPNGQWTWWGAQGNAGAGTHLVPMLLHAAFSSIGKGLGNLAPAAAGITQRLETLLLCRGPRGVGAALFGDGAAGSGGRNGLLRLGLLLGVLLLLLMGWRGAGVLADVEVAGRTGGDDIRMIGKVGGGGRRGLKVGGATLATAGGGRVLWVRGGLVELVLREMGLERMAVRGMESKGVGIVGIGGVGVGGGLVGVVEGGCRGKVGGKGQLRRRGRVGRGVLMLLLRRRRLLMLMVGMGVSMGGLLGGLLRLLLLLRRSMLGGRRTRGLFEVALSGGRGVPGIVSVREGESTRVVVRTTCRGRSLPLRWVWSRAELFTTRAHTRTHV